MEILGFRYSHPHQWRIKPRKKGSAAEGQLLISLFSINRHFLLRQEIDQ